MNTRSLCLVAIAKDESDFIEEWIAYHRLLGVDHFFVYDNDTEPQLSEQLMKFSKFVTVVPWNQEHGESGLEIHSKQVQAYQHALLHGAKAFEWVCFLDIDEFIVLRKAQKLPELLVRHSKYDAIFLRWYYFGHNGYFENPDGLVTESLTRRKKDLARKGKCISRVSKIVEIHTVHECVLQPGSRFYYPKQSMRAGIPSVHINHYHCRSFQQFMNRPQRGDAAVPRGPKRHEWRYDEKECLKFFVREIARDFNEEKDEFMLQYSHRIRKFLSWYI